MILNLDRRVNFWNKNHIKNCQGGAKFTLNTELFRNKNILEIGPGEGRQYEIAVETAKTYSIADICQTVLDLEIYNNCQHRLLIKNYTENFNIKFDLIHCWYVVHHVRFEEIFSFLQFVSNHLNDNGIFYFNYPNMPQDEAHNGYLNNDGLKTTPYAKEEFLPLVKNFFHIETLISEAFNADVLTCTKK